ncbi:MAG: cell envelope integrity protein CreD [bacterium]|nr:cell envelope integrity protein CreD [bacterium]
MPEKQDKDVHYNSIGDFLKRSIVLRIAMVGGLIIILLIPFRMIMSLVDERADRRNSVVWEINSKWADSQVIGGPVLEIPYKVYIKTKIIEDKKEKINIKEKIRKAYFLPQQLNISGDILPEIRYRGIYKSVVYTAGLKIEGSFAFPDFSQWNIPDKDILWENARLSFGISEMRGVNKHIEFAWNNKKLRPKPGVTNKKIFAAGVNSPVDIKKEKNSKNDFTMALSIKGSRSIGFLPLGRKTEVDLTSSWRSPSFNGVFLPARREIDLEGFRAHWEIFDYNREFPQQWNRCVYDVSASQFGAALFVPVDAYSKTNRSVKYAVLFISLTFLAFLLMIEVLNKTRIHPLQYLLVGFALCMFYLLLLSLSEHVSFGIAYLISAAAITLLTTVYARSVSHKNSLTFMMGGLVGGLYAFLYVMLSLEDYSLLMGSLGLFIILSAVMLFTRKIDWYTFKLGTRTEKN